MISTSNQILDDQFNSLFPKVMKDAHNSIVAITPSPWEIKDTL